MSTNWSMKTQIPLIPCLLYPIKMPPFDPFCQKIQAEHFLKGWVKCLNPIRPGDLYPGKFPGETLCILSEI